MLLRLYKFLVFYVENMSRKFLFFLGNYFIYCVLFVAIIDDLYFLNFVAYSNDYNEHITDKIIHKKEQS